VLRFSPLTADDISKIESHADYAHNRGQSLLWWNKFCDYVRGGGDPRTAADVALAFVVDTPSPLSLNGHFLTREEVLDAAAALFDLGEMVPSPRVSALLYLRKKTGAGVREAMDFCNQHFPELQKA